MVVVYIFFHRNVAYQRAQLACFRLFNLEKKRHKKTRQKKSGKDSIISSLSNKQTLQKQEWQHSDDLGIRSLATRNKSFVRGQSWLHERCSTRERSALGTGGGTDATAADPRSAAFLCTAPSVQPTSTPHKTRSATTADPRSAALSCTAPFVQPTPTVRKTRRAANFDPAQQS